jgi:type I restriction enzyme S subunit
MPSELFKEPQEGSLPYLLIDGLDDGESLYTNETYLPTSIETDTVVVADGSRSGLAIRGMHGVLGSTLLAYRARHGIDPDYLFYVLQSLYPFSNTATIGGAIPHLDKRLLAMLTLATPDSVEQRRIAGALRLADDSIQKARQEMDYSRHLNRSLKEDFLTGQLDPLGRPTTKTRIGDLPQGWSVSPLKTLAEICSGVSLNQDRAAKENACRYLTVAHVQRGAINSDDPRFLELSDAEREHRLLETGDVLVVEGHASSMEIGRAALFANQGEPTTFQNHLFRVRADSDRILPSFLLHILNSERVQRHWNAVCNTSSGLNTINRRNLRNVLVQYPDTSEQQQIIDALDAGERNLAQVAAKVRALEDLKRSLLQNLLTGRIRIPEGVIHA